MAMSVCGGTPILHDDTQNLKGGKNPGCESSRSKTSGGKRPGWETSRPKTSGAKRPGPKCQGAKRPGPKCQGAFPQTYKHLALSLPAESSRSISQHFNRNVNNIIVASILY